MAESRKKKQNRMISKNPKKDKGFFEKIAK
jgi:hypothetical protein